jgi:hypothetical protein
MYLHHPSRVKLDPKLKKLYELLRKSSDFIKGKFITVEHKDIYHPAGQVIYRRRVPNTRNKSKLIHHEVKTIKTCDRVIWSALKSKDEIEIVFDDGFSIVCNKSTN